MKLKTKAKLAIIFGVMALTGCKDKPVPKESSLEIRDPLDKTIHTIIYEETKNELGQTLYQDKNNGIEYIVGNDNLLLSRESGNENWTAKSFKPDGTQYISSALDAHISIDGNKCTFLETDMDRITINKSGTLFVREQSDLNAAGNIAYYRSNITYKKPDETLYETKITQSRFSIKKDSLIIIDNDFSVVQISNSDVFAYEGPFGIEKSNVKVMFKMPNNDLYNGETSEKVKMLNGVTQWIDTNETEFKIHNSGVTSIKEKDSMYWTVMFKDKDDTLCTEKTLNVEMTQSDIKFTNIDGAQFKIDAEGKLSITPNNSKNKLQPKI